MIQNILIYAAICADTIFHIWIWWLL